MTFDDCTVVKVLYPKPEDSVEGRQFCIMRVKVTQNGINSEKICKGTMYWMPAEGERITMEGREEVYRGELQIRMTAVEPYRPEDSRAILNYACELTAGLGPATASALWDAYAESWVVEAENGTATVRGLTHLRRSALVDTIEKIRREAEKTKIVSGLMARALTRNMAEAAWTKWMLKTNSIIETNPYRLSDLPNYGFNDADSVAMNGFAIASNDKRRVAAFILYTLDKACDSDSMMLRTALDAAIRDKFGPVADIVTPLNDLTTNGRIVLQGNDVIPKDLFDAETAIYQYAMGGKQ